MTRDIRIPGFTLIFLIAAWLLFSCNRQPEQSASEGQTSVNKIILSDAQIQLANIKVSEIVECEIGDKITFTGVLKVNEQSVVNISSRVNGRIQKLFFKNTGEIVHKGDSLYQFYSDELVAAQREYFTLESNNWNFSGRYEPSLALENRLLLMGMLPSQITQLKKDGKILFSVTICSPESGVIRSVNVTEGQYVKGGQSLFELADDSRLWVEAQVYHDDLQFLKVGMPSTSIIPGSGNTLIEGHISFIYPSVEKGKNVTLIRMQIDNPDKNLYPGMLAFLSIQSQRKSGIALPASAVITDKSGSRIWIRNEDGSFSGRMVTTGIQSEDSVLILSGVSGTEKVVTSGVYLLNSELILKNGTITGEKMEM
jgi:Cu(I)/Ag(I) efflux system membrane fusion protein